MAFTCPHCKVEHYEHKLTCRRCGKYMDQSSPERGASPMGGVMVLLGLLVVALLVGAACVIILRPKGPAENASAPVTGQVAQTTTGSVDQPHTGGRRHGRHKHR